MAMSVLETYTARIYTYILCELIRACICIGMTHSIRMREN